MSLLKVTTGVLPKPLDRSSAILAGAARANESFWPVLKKETKGAVAIIGNFLSTAGGTRDVCEDLAARLSEAGWSVITASHKKARLPRLWDMLATVYRRRHEFAVAQIDVFSGPAFIWAEAVCGLLRRLAKPCVLTLHGGSLPDFARRHPARVRRLLASARVVTTPSRFLWEQMQPYRRELRLLPNALDLARYPFRLRPQPEPLLVWLRAFDEIYNPTLGPEVLARVAQAYPSARLVMVGPDKGDGSLRRTRRTAAEHHVLDRLATPGVVPKSEVPAWLSRGDIFLNTTDVDNAPVSVIEAMACGLCVVSTNVGGLRYLLDPEHDALLVPPKDAEAMAAAVLRLLREPGLAERLSRNGRAKAGQCDWSVVLPQWEALLASVARGAADDHCHEVSA